MNMSVIKKPYEISVWKDLIQYVGQKYTLTNVYENDVTYYQKYNDYVMVENLTEEQFNNNKILYFYKDENDQYINCSDMDFNNNETYYVYAYNFNIADPQPTSPLPLNTYYKIVNDESTSVYDFYSIDYQYYTELRLATIGSDIMTSPARAINPILTRNINGTETLTFDMYYQYVDNETGEMIHNPFINFLVNERKVKLYYNDDDPNHPDHWYDFIIKKDDEKARDNKYSFTCTSLAANELGKTGFKIELDTELENNMGTVQELGEKVLEGSDWQLAAQGQDIIQQTINEPLYKIKIKQDLNGITFNPKVRKTGADFNESLANKYIYVYYTPYSQKETDYFQFIYIKDNATITTLTDKVTLVCDDENIWDLYLDEVIWEDDKPNFQNGEANVAQYRGDRYVRKQKTTYDSTLKKTVKIYTDNSDPAQIVYGYQTTRYYDVNSIYNYIHNSTNFGNTSYWSGYGNGTKPTTIERVIYPPINGDNVDEERTNYLSVFIGNDWDEGAQKARIMNNGIVYNYAKINTFDAGEYYIFRAKVKGYTKSTDSLSGYLKNDNDFPFTCQVRKYIKIDEYTTDDECYFSFSGSNAEPDYNFVEDLTEEEFNLNKTRYYTYNGTDFDQCTNQSEFNQNTNYFISEYAIIIAECKKSASWNDLKENLGIFLFRSGNYNTRYTSYFIEDIQLYKAIPREIDGYSTYYTIGDIPEIKYETVDHYYYPDENGGFTNPDDYTYITDTYYKANINASEFNSDKTKYWYIENGEWIHCDENSVYNSQIQYYTLLVFTPVYGSGAQEFEKVRSLSKKESNRFNLLQELCETFECWVKFNIAHETGENPGEIAGRIQIEEYDYYSPIAFGGQITDQSEIEQGSISIKTGENADDQKSLSYRIRTKNFISVSPGSSYKIEENIKNNTNLTFPQYNIIQYDQNKNYITRTGWKRRTEDYIFTPTSEIYYIRIVFCKSIVTTSGAQDIRVSEFDYAKILPIKQRIDSDYYIYNNLTKTFTIAPENGNYYYYEQLTRRRQNKKVIFYGEILENNPIGFKYGINLKDVQRTLDSDQIATKIIVKNNSCEQADNGFCSIARAKDNPVKENFLYNFDYYIKQGILDQSSLNNDLYLKTNGSIGLYPRLIKYNSEKNQLISKSAEMANSLMELTSETQEALLEYNSAKEELWKLTDPVSGKLYSYSNYTYDNFLNQVSICQSGEYISSCPKQVYYIKNGTGLRKIEQKSSSKEVVEEIKKFYKIVGFERIRGDNLTGDDVVGQGDDKKFNGNAGLKYYYESGRYYTRCEKNEKIVSDRTYILFGNISNVNYAKKTPFYITSDNSLANEYDDATKLPITKTYYWQYGKDVVITDNGFSNDVYFQIGKKYVSFTYDNNSSPQVYIYGAYSRIDTASVDDTVNDTKTIDYITQIQTLEKTVKESNERYIIQNNCLKETQQNYDDIQARLTDIAKATEEIENEFNFKYARYIQEGSWNDDSYMDDDLYYLDAVNVLYQSAYPKVSYTINVLELSALEEFKNYRFQIAHKTFIEDTEFFGWIDYINKIPARENVVVTELTTAFDEPDKNTIKVQNYKSHFEDLFQRISAATQNLEYHSGDYARASDVIQNNGTIQESVLQSSLATAAYVLSNSNNQTVVIDETGLQATRVSNPAEVLRITSGGILISNDGQQTWGVAISAYGINTERLSAGTINTENITIMNGNYPTFKWNGEGLYAYGFIENEGTISNYTNNKYVTFNRFGLYGVNDGTNFTPQTVSDIEKKANFALTWNGLFIRSNYRDGYVSISPTDDITLYSYSSKIFNEILPIENYLQIDTDSTDFENNKANYYYYDEENEEYKTCENEEYNSEETYYIKEITPGVDEEYYYQNRRVFYINYEGYIINCTDELYNEIPNNILYITDYQIVEKPASEEWESCEKTSYYYLYNGKYIQCTNDFSYDLLPDIVFNVSSGSIDNAAPMKRAKFGMLGQSDSGEELYGLALYNKSGNPTVITQSDGTLWLQDSMKIGIKNQTNEIYIGVGELEEENEIYKVIKVEGFINVDVNATEFNNNKTKYWYIDNNEWIRCDNNSSFNSNIIYYILDENFVVYSDGTLKANQVSIRGRIEAIEGWIGSEDSGALITENGISIQGGGFEILGNNNSKLLEVINNNENIELIINGTINANSGEIGGFTIDNHRIYDNNLILESSYIEEVKNIVEDINETEFNNDKTKYWYIDENNEWIHCDENSIYDSEIQYYTSDEEFHDSKITVENINIGIGANIVKYLQIGNFKLLNPNDEDNSDKYVAKLQIGDQKKVTKDLEPIIGKKYYTLDENNQYVLFTGSSFNWGTIYYEDDIKFSLSDDGNLIATNVNITGIIYAQDGEFSGTITAGTINATTINTANFITQKIRSMGGAFIFKPSYEIKDQEIFNENTITKIKVWLENNNDYNQFEAGNIISFSNGENGILYGEVDDLVTQENYSVVEDLNENIFNQDKTKYYYKNNEEYIQCTEDSSFNSEGTYYIKEITIYIKIIPYFNLSDDDTNFNPTTITWFGKNTIGNIEGDIVIGINSDSISGNSFLKPKSLTIQNFNIQKTNNELNISSSVKLLLGDLNGSPIPKQNNQDLGYGLYADNVYLHGSLITQTGNSSSYAGVNTQKNQGFSYNKWTNPTALNYDEDTKYINDKIIFWGGAESLESDSITKSPFIVTDKGNIFARNGEFKGTVITDSIVSNSIIKAAIIEGIESSPSLKIYDTGNGGISFYKKVGNIDNNTNNEINDIETLRISNDGIYCYSYQGISNPIIGFSENNNSVIFKPTLININTTEISQGQIYDENKLTLESTDIVNFANVIKIQSKISGSKSNNISYQLKDNYYCLFVE